MLTKENIGQYFIAFKNEQLFLIIMGLLALVVAIVFFAGLKTQWYKGFALPLAVFAVLNMGAGFSNYKKADILKIRNTYNYDLHPELLRTKELPRLNEMNRNFTVLIYVNISIIVAAAFIFFYFKKKDRNEYYMGVAASLFIVAVLSVAIYSVLKSRSKNYEKGIIEYTKDIIIK